MRSNVEISLQILVWALRSLAGRLKLLAKLSKHGTKQYRAPRGSIEASAESKYRTLFWAAKSGLDLYTRKRRKGFVDNGKFVNREKHTIGL